MTASSIITPFRWYTNFFDQHRFSKDCKSVCPFELITDHRHLLPFQFKRDRSPFLITDWVLRKHCDEPLEEMLSDADKKFVEGSDTWEQTGAWLYQECGGVKFDAGSGHASDTICWTGLSIGKEYTVYFNIKDYLQVSPTLLFKLKNGTIVIGTYNTPGPVSATFTATATSICFVVENSVSLDDIVIVDYCQVYEAFEVSSDDIELDPDQIVLKNFGSYDYIQYCGEDLALTIPEGDYYSVIKTEDGTLYFSEVISVKAFSPEKSPYIIFEWWNECDIQDVIYQTISDCSYINRLYLDKSVLTKPTWPFKEEGEEDGNKNFNPTFQQWKKHVSLVCGKVPEFIVDALTGSRLHDTIQYITPCREKQEVVDAASEIQSLEYDVAPVFNECYFNIDLKMLMKEQFVDESCCTNQIEASCECDVTIPTVDDQGEPDQEWALLTDGTDMILQQKIDGVWTTVEPDEGMVVCEEAPSDGSTGRWIYNPGGGDQIDPGMVSTNGWYFTPKIGNIAFVPSSGNKWTLRGNLAPMAYGIVEFSTDGGTNWTDATPKFTPAQFAAGVTVTLNPVPCCGNFQIRVRSFDLNGCEWGTTVAESEASPTSDCC